MAESRRKRAIPAVDPDRIESELAPLRAPLRVELRAGARRDVVARNEQKTLGWLASDIQHLLTAATRMLEAMLPAGDSTRALGHIGVDAARDERWATGAAA